MYLKRFRASSVLAALKAVREELGPDALVLSTEMVARPGWQGWFGSREVEITAAAEREVSNDRPVESARRQGTVDRQLGDLAAQLTAAGLSPDLADEVATAVPAGRRRGASFHSLRAALAQRLSPLAADDSDLARVEIFVGPPGAGKTTTIAKIASQERARKARRVGLVAADGFRVGAVEQLRAYAEILGAPFRVARTGDELARVLASRHRQPLLVDTAGRSPGDSASRELFDVVTSRDDVRTHLVIPADMSPGSVGRIFDAYTPVHPTRIVLTKLDQVESLSPLVTLLRDRQLPISYLGLGQHVPEDLCRATASQLAACVLGEQAFPQAMRA